MFVGSKYYFYKAEQIQRQDSCPKFSQPWEHAEHDVSIACKPAVRDGRQDQTCNDNGM